MVIGLHGTGGVVCAGMLSVACGLAAGCGVAGTTASHPAADPATTKAKTQRVCAEEISAATAAQEAAINRYWTPLARSAITMVSKGKISVPEPKKHLTRAQRRALLRAEWAERAFGPKPRLVCQQIPAGGVPSSVAPVAPQSRASAPGSGG
jgi:hypothetical protein